VLLLVAPLYQFVLKHRLPLDIPRTWKRAWKSVVWTNLGLAILIAGARLFVGLKSFLLVQLPITLVSGALGVWLFYVQHQFEDTYWREHPEWDFHRAAIEGSSFYDLPVVLHWFTGNIGFHHVHHLASRIPNYRLRECFSARARAAASHPPDDPRQSPLRPPAPLGRRRGNAGRLSPSQGAARWDLIAGSGRGSTRKDPLFGRS
jgi:fatty acid desaturase